MPRNTSGDDLGAIAPATVLISSRSITLEDFKSRRSLKTEYWWQKMGKWFPDLSEFHRF
jgi:hypothetical protein